ncbi:MAG TPA: hypothetical protein PLK13_02360 [Xanthobacteraceae bacterium]|jgi:hypothetical protein|nr:hypothetical protein [Xanthobacteraceae bacterium]HQS46380.1 hypothetical protein [Xanthobacteraceae bacterium]
MARNPFQQLYVGEKVDPEEFVEIFSHKLVQHAMPLFQPGHVVLSGVQGSGKSMLFKLFQPEVRAAYAAMKKEFPIPADSFHFIGAGININTARCNEFGNRRPEAESSTQELMFGDFFNYVVCLDMIKSVRMLAAEPSICSALGLKLQANQISEFVCRVRESDVWEGYLDETRDLESLVARMHGRVALYRRYMNGNDKSLNAQIASSKTSAGEPMKILVNAFKASGAVPNSTEFYVVVDQYEELAVIKGGDKDVDYRSVVNKVISRDPTLSYRIGTRGYAWRNHLNVFGSHGHLEQDRDYKLVEIDATLRAQEIGGTSIYPDFANDVFLRRLRYSATSGTSRAAASRISDALGRSPTPKDEAILLAGHSPGAVVRPDPEWPPAIVDGLRELATVDPLSAKLGEVWYRQKGIEGTTLEERPWEARSKQYWRKERIELCLLAIGGLRKQRVIYSGEENILGLSGRNILLFLSLCQYIWDYATQSSASRDREPELPVSRGVQTIGVFQTARTWLDRIPSDYGRSDDRYKLIQLLGEKFSTALHGDLKMSNPGQNGISLSIEDLRANPDIFRFLIEAVDYGNLVMIEHATRNKDRKRRYKFYLNPLYCPIYRIPYQHSKEPIYITVERFKEWLAEAGVVESLKSQPARGRAKPLSNLPLLDMMDRTRD